MEFEVLGFVEATHITLKLIEVIEWFVIDE